MKIAYIAAGAGRMRCGACSWDMALVQALGDRGHHVWLIPLYTPLMAVDRLPVKPTRVFYGGINVYLEQVSSFFRRTPHLLDHLLDSEWLLGMASYFALSTAPQDLGPMTVSVLEGQAGNQRRELDKLLHFLGESRPQVVGLANSLLSALAPPVREQLHIPVVSALQGEDGFVASFPEPYRTRALDAIRRNCRSVDLFLAPGTSYAHRMASYLDVPEERIAVVGYGIDTELYQPRPEQGQESSKPSHQAFTVGYLSRLTPGKGLDILVEAVRILVQEERRDVRLRVAGQRLDAKFWRNIQSLAAARGLAERFEYVGELGFDDKVAFLRELDVFCLPSRHPEAHGTAAMEAMACGIPVVVPALGVFPELVERTGGGIMFPPGDSVRLASELAGLMDEPARWRELGRRAREGIVAHYSTDAMAADATAAFGRLRIGDSRGAPEAMRTEK